MAIRLAARAVSPPRTEPTGRARLEEAERAQSLYADGAAMLQVVRVAHRATSRELECASSRRVFGTADKSIIRPTSWACKSDSSVK